MFKDIFSFFNRNRNIAFITIGLLIILYSKYIRAFFGMDYGADDINLILDAIFGLALVLIGLLYKFKKSNEDSNPYL